jgi:hypothetical protein
VSKEEALQYLKLREIDEEQAAQIYELVGGRMVHLAADIKTSDTLEGICTAWYVENGFSPPLAMRQTIFSDTKSQLKSAEILPDRHYHKNEAKIVGELLKKGSISEDAYYSLVGADTGDKLLEGNRFAF